jgi:hypothetical protein
MPQALKQYSATPYLLQFASITHTPSIIQIAVILAHINDPTRADCHTARVQLLPPVIWSRLALIANRPGTFTFRLYFLMT